VDQNRIGLNVDNASALGELHLLFPFFTKLVYATEFLFPFGLLFVRRSVGGGGRLSRLAYNRRRRRAPE
jgi:hypothetical protein